MTDTAEPTSEPAPAVHLAPAAPRPGRGPLPLAYPERAPVLSLAAAAVVSFVVLMIAPGFAVSILMRFPSTDGTVGPLALPIFLLGPVLTALAGSGVLTVITLAIATLQRHRFDRPDLPYLLSLPVAWAIVLPSWLEHGGPILVWLVFGAMLAAAFCLHWFIFSWAHSVWD